MVQDEREDVDRAGTNDVFVGVMLELTIEDSGVEVVLPRLTTQSPCTRRGFLFLQSTSISPKTPSNTWHYCGLVNS